MRTKTYVLTLSDYFPKGHPREGEETEFAGKALAASQIEMRPVFTPWKLHTIRANYGLTLEDWMNWFKGYDRTRPMAIIHFTNFRYCK